MNHYVVNDRGFMVMKKTAIGPNAQVNISTQPDETTKVPGRRSDVGVITILPVEAQEVTGVLGLTREMVGGIPFQVGIVDEVSVAAVRTLDKGQQSVMSAYGNLVREFDPKIVVLTGIGGAIHKSVKIGDVVVATEMVYYDLRKITPKGTVPRGFSRTAPAPVIHAVNSFFDDLDPPRITITDPQRTTRKPAVMFGPVGSGGAVIANEDAEQIVFLSNFNDKILAVEMEAGGLSQACHERTASTGRSHGWLVIRGISDRANAAKSYGPQRVAALHAAHVLRRLVPYLKTAR